MSEYQLNELHQKINQGVQKAIADALEKHRKLGEAVSFMQDGKIITVKGEEIANFINNPRAIAPGSQL
jgi:hypothetical protein